jgi:hypothetical protein
VSHLDPNKLCFKSDSSLPPYKFTPVYNNIYLDLTICRGNVKPLHLHMIKNYLNFPTQQPDALMMKQY